MRRIVSLVAVACMLAFGLAACAGEEEVEAPEPIATAAGTSTPNSNLGTGIQMPATCRYPDARSDPEIIATGIVSRQSEDLVFDSEEFGDLSRELERVLGLIHDAYPNTASIRAADHYIAGRIALGVEPALKEAIQDAFAAQPGSTDVKIGRAGFDALSEQLGGLRGAWISPYGDNLELCLGELVNVKPAAEAYAKLEGVEYAEPGWTESHGPDIDALREGDTWYVVFREDCRSGCLYQEQMYFTVTGDSVVAVEACRAAVDPNFVSLVELVGGYIPPVLLGTPEPNEDPWGEKVGVGVYLDRNPSTGETVVVSPIVGSPGERAGIEPGDVILAIDGQSISGWAGSEVIERFGGPACTEVNLTIRHDDGRVEEFVILRDIFVVSRPVDLRRITMSIRSGTVTGVICVADVGPAADKAGIRYGDLILAVNGESTAEWTVADAVDRLDYYEDKLTFTVRHDDGRTEDITLSTVLEPSCPPVLPGTYTGTAYVNAEPAPAGSVIEAVQGGVTWGTATTGNAGGYEMNVPEPMRLSPPCAPGGPISFRMGDLTAKESVDLSPGPKELNLTFTSLPATAGP